MILTVHARGANILAEFRVTVIIAYKWVLQVEI